MSRVPFNLPVGTFLRLRAAFIPETTIRAYLAQVQSLLLADGVHAGAVERWRLGWLTESYPDDEARLFLASGYSAIDAARNIARRIEPYTEARRRVDQIEPLLRERHKILPRIIKDWLIEMRQDDWSLVDELNKYVLGRQFDRDSAAAGIAIKLEPVSSAFAETVEAMFDEADDRADREKAEKLAREEAEGMRRELEAKYLTELKAKRIQSDQNR
jgi:hypothetical protein